MNIEINARRVEGGTEQATHYTVSLFYFPIVCLLLASLFTRGPISPTSTANIFVFQRRAKKSGFIHIIFIELSQTNIYAPCASPDQKIFCVRVNDYDDSDHVNDFSYDHGSDCVYDHVNDYDFDL
uniref:Transmembrane protein n=1 Tax=Heterorhabditis bacteriophora TaxID=37862 RepID=A0A1I7WTP9_HETBA